MAVGPTEFAVDICMDSQLTLDPVPQADLRLRAGMQNAELTKIYTEVPMDLLI
jgi:hypothetical protein